MLARRRAASRCSASSSSERALTVARDALGGGAGRADAARAQSWPTATPRCDSEARVGAAGAGARRCAARRPRRERAQAGAAAAAWAPTSLAGAPSRSSGDGPGGVASRRRWRACPGCSCDDEGVRVAAAPILVLISAGVAPTRLRSSRASSWRGGGTSACTAPSIGRTSCPRPPPVRSTRAGRTAAAGTTGRRCRRPARSA